MEADVRACVAYVAWRLVHGLPAFTIYDRFEGKSYPLTGSVAADRVHVYDCNENCYFGGLFNGVQFNLWHYARRYFVDLKIEADGFSGFDHGSRRHFHGHVHGGEIDLCDRETNSYFHYQM